MTTLNFTYIKTKMEFSFNDLAKPALLAGQMILSGWAGAAAAAEPGLTQFGFPEKNEGYSRATDTAFKMTCRDSGHTTVCTIDAFGNLPLLHIQQEFTITQGQTIATGDAELGWGPDKFRYDYSPIMERAGDPQYTGNYQRLEKGVRVGDIVPVTSTEGVGISVAFNKGDGRVEMKVGLITGLGETFGPYQGRPFDFAGGGDESHMNRLLGKVKPVSPKP